MATFAYREVTTKRCEWLVPAPEPGGACWVEVQKAIASARQALTVAGLLFPGSEPADDQIRIRGGEDEVIVFIESPEVVAAL